MSGSAELLREKVPPRRKTSRARWAALLTGAFALSAALPVARAQTPAPPAPTRSVREALSLGASTCIEADALAAQISMWLGGRPLDARIAISVEDGPNGVRFTVTRDAQSLGSRTLHVVGVPCQQIHAAVGLGVAVAIDATVLDSLGVTPTPAPPAPAAPAPAPAPPPPAAPPPPIWQPPPLPPSPPDEDDGPVAPWLTSTVQGLVLLGVLPEVQVGLSPSFDINLLRGFDIRIGALGTPEVRVDVGRGEANVSLVAGRLDACVVAVLRKNVARLRGCAGVTAGAISAEGVGFEETRASTAPWIAPTARIDGRWSFGRVFGLLLGVDGFFPGLKPELEVLSGDGSVQAARAFPAAGVALSVGPSITF